MIQQRADRPWPPKFRHRAQQRAIPPQPNGRTKTIKTLIERFIAENGKPPADIELAALLAISVDRVRWHRNMLGM